MSGRLILSMDMSLRSSGICIINMYNELIYYRILETKKEDFVDDEELILYVESFIDELIVDYPEIKQFVIEGLSFNSKSAKKDVIAGLYWGIRCLIYDNYPHILIGSVPVMTWRKWAVSKAEIKDAKLKCRDHLKNVVFTKLPDDIQKKFLLYVEEHNLNIKSVYDLADAYSLALFRNSLNV